MVLIDPLCAVSRAMREKLHTIEKESTALPKAQHASCVNHKNQIIKVSVGFAHVASARRLG
jgi:hypothetical protein